MKAPVALLICLISLQVTACPSGGITAPVVMERLNPAQPTIFHVAKGGSDATGDGSQDKPWASVAFAASRVGSNGSHTIQVGPGIFQEPGQIILETGVNLLGSGIDETVLTSTVIVVDSPDGKAGFLIVASSSVNQTELLADPTNIPSGNQMISGFTIDGWNKTFNGLWVERRNDVTLDNLRFRDCFGMGARVFEQLGKDAAYLTGIRITECEFINSAMDINRGSSGYDPGDWSTGNLNIGGLDGAEIAGITIRCEFGYGIKFTRDGYFRNTKIYDCDIEVPESDPMWGEDIAIELWNLGPGNEVYNIRCNTWLSFVNHPGKFTDTMGGLNLRVYRVSIRDNDGLSSKEGIECALPGVVISESFIQDKGFGIAVWDQGSHDITIHNNIIQNRNHRGAFWNGGAGVFIANSKAWDFSDIRILNNVFDTVNNGVYLKTESSAGIHDIIIANNVYLNLPVGNSALLVGQADSGTLISVENIQLAHNLVDNGAALLRGKSDGSWLEQSGNHLDIDPLYSDLVNEYEISEYRPTVDSPLIDSGVFVGLPFNGSAPDIGYVETAF